MLPLSINLQYFLVFLVSFSSWFCLLPLPSIFPSILCFRWQCLWKMWPIQLAILFIVNKTSLSSMTVCNTWSVQLIFSVFLQHHVSKQSGYFLSTFWSVQISAPNKPMLQMQHFISFFLKFKSSLLAKSLFLLVEWCFFNGNPGLNFTCTLCIICYATKIFAILHTFWLFLIYHIFIWDSYLKILKTMVFSTFISILTGSVEQL